MHYRKLTPFAVSEKKWDTNEDKGKSMMHALYVLRYAKRYCQAGAVSNNEKHQTYINSYSVMPVLSHQLFGQSAENSTE